MEHLGFCPGGTTGDVNKPWEEYIAESARAEKPVEVYPQDWDGAPFRIDFRSDTITVSPLCDFGLDYVFTATKEDLEERPYLVFGHY